VISQSAQFDSSSSIAPTSRAPTRLRSMLLAITLTIVIVCGDFLTSDINFSILYILPLLVISRMHRPRAVWQWAVALSVLTFAGYFAGVRGAEINSWQDLVNFRLVNRAMMAATLMASAALIHIQIGLRELIDRRARLVHASAEEEHAFDQILASFDRFATTILCLVLIGLVTLTDVLTPPQFNIPILFALPLVASARIQQRWIVWAIVPLLLLMSVVGLYLGPKPLPTHIKDAMIINRIFASLVLIGVAAILHGWIGSRSR
jgi:hypothetical protein